MPTYSIDIIAFSPTHTSLHVGIIQHPDWTHHAEPIPEHEPIGAYLTYLLIYAIHGHALTCPGGCIKQLIDATNVHAFVLDVSLSIWALCAYIVAMHGIASVASALAQGVRGAVLAAFGDASAVLECVAGFACALPVGVGV